MNLDSRIATPPIPAKVSVHYAQALPFLRVVIPEPSLATIPDSSMNKRKEKPVNCWPGNRLEAFPELVQALPFAAGSR